MMPFPHKFQFLLNPTTQNCDIIPNKKQVIVKKRSQFIHKKTFNHFGALHSKTANINEYSFTIDLLPAIKILR